MKLDEAKFTAPKMNHILEESKNKGAKYLCGQRW